MWKTKKGGDNVKTNYTMNGRAPIQLHHYGAYMSYSDSAGDYLHAPVSLRPYTKTEVVREQVGTKQVILKKTETQRVPNRETGGWTTVVMDVPKEPYVIEQPVYEAHGVIVPTEYQTFGKPIKEGDKVTFDGVAGTLEVLTDTHFIITNDKGKHYYPWSSTGKVARVQRVA